jgi:hypothetical protein
MCITNDDATRNGNKRSNAMKKKENAWRGKIKKEGNDEKVVTIEKNKKN